MKKTHNVIFQIGTRFGDSVEFLDLFSRLLEQALTEQKKQKRFEVPFAFLFTLSRQKLPLTDLREFCRQRIPVREWRRNVRTSQPSSRRAEPKGGMFWTLLESCLEAASGFGIQDGSQVCRILAAVGQTLNGKNAWLRLWNSELARERSAFESARARRDASSRLIPRLPHVATQSSTLIPDSGFLTLKRDDEQGQCLSAGNLVIWHASFIGPRCASKTENQDATAVRILDGDAVFALADGVSTSLGARLAAAAVAHQFCEVYTSVFPWNGNLIEANLDPLLHWLDSLLIHLLAHPDSRDFRELCGRDFQPASVARLLENTKTGKIPNMPTALAATLIAGVVSRDVACGQFRVNLLRVGDGLVERVDRNGSVEPVLEMDPDVLAVPAALGPGPRARSALSEKGAILTKQVTIQEGEFLLISSDGLARGHHDPVAAKLNELLQRDVLKQLRRDDEAAALSILRSACEKADEFRETDRRTCLFADNVSLIVIGSLAR